MADDDFNTLNVMVIEDEAFSQKVVSELLKALGVGSLTVAENGADALAKLESTPAKIHLIICDIEMPEMGGFEFVRQIRFGTLPAYKDVPIVMLTGKDTDKNAQSARIHKISGFLVKPAKPKTLENAIRHALGI
ncbi:MAG: response regulator [Rhodospirillales bacterium]|nr:response regulator [Rhodospirillales bacterium]